MKPKPWTKEETEMVMRMYKKGHTCKDIAAKMKRTYSAIKAKITDEKHKKGEARRYNCDQTKKTELEREIIAYYANNRKATTKDMAKNFKVSQYTVKSAFKGTPYKPEFSLDRDAERSWGAGIISSYSTREGFRA